MNTNNNITDLGKKLLLLIIIQFLLLTIVIAANDPGHDTLYIEEDGDSELNGSLNITDNMSVQGGIIRQPGGLILYGDDTIPAPGVNYISGTTGNNIYIDAQGNIYLKWMTAGAVFIGSGPSTVTNLNVSGALYVQGTTATVAGINICLENGTNCPASLGDANISGSGADNRVAFWTDGDTISYDDDLTWNRSANRLGIGTTNPYEELQINSLEPLMIFNDTDAGGFWYVGQSTNDFYIEPEDVDGHLYFRDEANTISLQIDNAQNDIYIPNGKVGIGTISPSAKLEVNGSGNQLRINYDDTNHGNISVNSGGNMTITANGHIIIDLS